jgi:membrane carboxypeptidase/penicillin-binding protein
MDDRKIILSSESPMIKKVKERIYKKELKIFNKTIRIPKKGRIRFFLALIAVILFIKILLSHQQVNSPDKINTQNVKPSNNIKNQKTALKSNKEKENVKISAENKKDNNTEKAKWIFFTKKINEKKFSYSDLTNLFKKHSPRLDCINDTVLSGREKYILHYSFDTTVIKCGKDLLKNYHPKYGAFVAMEAATGRVLALVSYSREGEQNIGENLFAKSIYPAASVFKTVTAAAALEKGNLHLESNLPLVGRKTTLYKFQLKEQLDYYEPVSLIDAYAYSINPIFGRIGIYILGKDVLQEYIDKFGFNSEIPFELKNEKPYAEISEKDSSILIAEIASGFNKKTRISPLFGAMIAACIAENGKMPVPYFVDSVTCEKDSDVIYRGEPKVWRTVIKESTAAQLRSMMHCVATYGTAKASFKYIKKTSFFENIEYGGKTGTLDEEELGRIDWFIGFAIHPNEVKNRIAVGVLTIHDQFWTVHSSFIAAEIFRKYMRYNLIEQKASAKNITNGEAKKTNG